MARPPAANPKCEIVSVRLSRDEAAVLDAIRGALTRSEWLRWTILLEKKKGTS